MTKPAQLLPVAVDAAHQAGALMRTHFRHPKKITSASQFDIKLELDVRCQRRIEKILRRATPTTPILGEEGINGNPNEARRWVVDPIDGTVNFTYGIPHACVSIALQERTAPQAYQSVLGVIYDPFCDELWTALRGGRTHLNGRPIHASRRGRLEEAIVCLGFAKEQATLRRMLPIFNKMIARVRKMRIMGSAALGLAYVASGRMDAYIEFGLRIWDVAAGGLIIECAGGEFWSRPLPAPYSFQIIASNGLLRPRLAPLLKPLTNPGREAKAARGRLRR